MPTDDGEGLKASLQRPTCQVAACFERASVYVVIKESDINALNVDAGEKQMMVERDSLADVNAFKLILYLMSLQSRAKNAQILILILMFHNVPTIEETSP
jgi:hypothetical protein